MSLDGKVRLDPLPWPEVLSFHHQNGRHVMVDKALGTAVCAIGDILMRWTNDRWLSNLHRVVNPPLSDGRPRLSIAFFNHPNYDVWIECIAPPGEVRHEPVLSGDYRDLKYSKIGLLTAR